MRQPQQRGHGVQGLHLPENPPAQGRGFVNPYNFVRLGAPGRRGPAPSHEKFAGLSGRIVCTLRLLTPLCLPDPERSTGGAEDHKFKPLLLVDGQPYIPGASLKGALRSVAEAVSGSCLSIIDRGLLIFRDNRQWTPTDKRLGVMRGVDAADGQRVAGDLDHPGPVGPGAFPQRGLFNQRRRPYGPWGTNLEWAGPLDVPAEVAELYARMVADDGFTLTERGRPARRPDPGEQAWLTDYDDATSHEVAAPYWWFRAKKLGKQQIVTQIGRNFRYKWAYDPLQAIPAAFHPCHDPDAPEGLCPACRLFGMAADESEPSARGAVRALAGRVAIGPARWIGETRQIERVDALKILGTPKASCRSLYLAASTGDFSVEYDDFLRMKGGQLVPAPIRGRKFYWHHTRAWDGRDLDYLKALPGPGGERPRNRLNADVEVLMPSAGDGPQFEFTVEFENLSEAELGSLLWTLALPGDNTCAHHLGLGKPLGLGSVQVKTKEVVLIDRAKRYRSPLALGETVYALPDLAAEEGPLQSYLQAFRDEVRAQNDVESFAEAPAVADLLVVLSTQQPVSVAPAGEVRLCYPPGIPQRAAGRDEDTEARDIAPEEVHYTWFGPRGWDWQQRLLTVQEVAEGRRQLEVPGEPGRP